MAAISQFEHASKDASPPANPRPIRRSWRRRFALSGMLTTIAALGLSSADAAEESNPPAEMMPVVLSEEPSPKSPAISVVGVVTDESGEPVAGASVVIRAMLGGRQYVFGFPHTRDVLARTTTNAEGRFRFAEIGIPPRMVETLDDLRQGRSGAQVLVWGDGYALQWKPVASLGETEMDFRLAKEADVSGVLNDEQGEPIAEGTLAVTGFTKTAGGMDGIFRSPGDLNLARSEAVFAAKIRDGRFSLANMPKDHFLSVRCESALGHRSFLLIDTGNSGLEKVTYEFRRGASSPVHRTPVHATASQMPWVRIRIVDHEGKPVAGGGVEAISPERQYGGAAAIGEDGTATLIVNGPGVHDVYYSGDPLHPVLGAVQQIDIQKAESPVVEIKLPAFRMVTGKVVDSDTGAPVAGVHVFGGIRDDSAQSPRANSPVAVSGVDGRFELPVVLRDGACSFSFFHDIDGYFLPTHFARQETKSEPKTSTIAVAADQVPEEALVPIARGLTIEGKVTDAQGMPAKGARVTASSESRIRRQTSTVADADGRFRLDGLSPYTSWRIFAGSETGIAEVEIPASEDHPWEKTLTTNVDLTLVAGISVAGQVMRGGRPASGVHVRLMRGERVEGGTRINLVGAVVTDEQGKYRLAGLKKGDEYTVEIEPQEGAEVRGGPFGFRGLRSVGVENGETIEMPDAVLISNGQILSGIVVDQDGKPLAGYSVSARFASGMELTRPDFGPPPWTETDDRGRFRLTNLPDEPISLMAYKANPGQPIRFPGHASPALNADDIRIVIDSRLPSEPESLD